MPAPETLLETVPPPRSLPPSSSAPWSLGWRVWRWEVADLVVGSVLAVLLVVAAGVVPAIMPGVPLALATPVLWRVDVAERRLPNSLVLPIGCLALGGIVATAVADATWPAGTVAGIAATFVFFLVLNLAGGMGMGDVKLAVVLASVLALVRLDVIVAAALIAFFAGGVAALVVHLRSRGRSIPFGPFLLVGFWVALILAG